MSKWEPPPPSLCTNENTRPHRSSVLPWISSMRYSATYVYTTTASRLRLATSCSNSASVAVLAWPGVPVGVLACPVPQVSAHFCDAIFRSEEGTFIFKWPKKMMVNIHEKLINGAILSYFQWSSLSAFAGDEKRISASPGRRWPMTKGIFWK